MSYPMGLAGHNCPLTTGFTRPTTSAREPGHCKASQII
jgi:hypothetical protein